MKLPPQAKRLRGAIGSDSCITELVLSPQLAKGAIAKGVK